MIVVLRAMVTQIEGNFRPCIPHANNQNALAGKRCRVDVSSTVEDSPSKFLGSGKCGISGSAFNPDATTKFGARNAFDVLSINHSFPCRRTACTFSPK